MTVPLIGPARGGRWCCGVLGCLWVLSCSAGSGQKDAGLPDGRTDADDGSGDGDGSVPADGVTLRIPAGSRLCNFDGTRNQLEVPLLKFQAVLKAGDHLLPLERGEFDDELVDELIAFPEGKRGRTQTPGRFRFFRQPVGEGKLEHCYYTYSQPFAVEAVGFDVTFGFWLPCDGAKLWILGQDASKLWPNVYLCGTLEQYLPGRVVATTTGGDRIEFDYRYHEACEDLVGLAGLCPMFYGDPTRGLFARGPQERVVADYFRLGLQCPLHLGPRFFIMVFDQPLDGIYGVTLDDIFLVPAEVGFLDANLSPVNTVPVATIQYE